MTGRITSVRDGSRVLIREKSEADLAHCLELLFRVHEWVGYPLHLPRDVPAFITPEYEAIAWVAECDGRMRTAVGVAQLGPGVGVEVPPGLAHQFANVGESDVVFLVTSTPTTRGDRRATTAQGG